MIDTQPLNGGETGDISAGSVRFSELDGPAKMILREAECGASMAAALLRWGRQASGLVRASLRLLSLGIVLPTAIAHAAIVRLITHPTAAALARSRTVWFHRWGILTCSLLGVEVEREGSLPVSGLVITNHMTLTKALLLASVAPFAFVVDMDLRNRPIIGWLARLSGALFHDRRRLRDVERINFVISRALKRRQLVVIFRSCEWRAEPALGSFPSALLQPAADACCTLTASAVCFRNGDTGESEECSGAGWAMAQILTQPRSPVTVAFHPPTFHYGDRKQLAQQLWSEVRQLERRATSNAVF